MRVKNVLTLIPVLLMCLCLTGCNLLQKLFPVRKEDPPPQAFTNAKQPTLEEITSTINRNSQNIRNVIAPNATIYIPGTILPLQSRITFERPKRMRIQGYATSLSGQEFDFGSNDTFFWIWTKRGPNEMWYCRHDLYQMSPIRSVIPIDPDWLIESLGIVEFKPTDQHLGPARMADGNWEIISYCQTPSGQYIKRTVIDSKIGWIKRQELYSPQRELVASAEADDVRYDRENYIYYAKQITVHCQGMDGKMTIDLGSPKFNSPVPFDSGMFLMPTFEGYRALDLSSPEFLQPRGVMMPAQMPNMTGAPVPEANIQTIIR